MIEEDLPCLQCQYNLRTLSVIARCPECGYPVMRSYVRKNATLTGGWMSEADFTYQACAIIATVLGRNVDSIHFVARAHRVEAARSAALKQPITAMAVCTAAVKYALDHYGNREDAAGTLRFWRIERSEDIGQIIAGLVEAGVIRPDEKASPRDYLGLCRIEDLFPQAE